MDDSRPSPNPRPAAHRADPADSPGHRVSRRWFVAGGAALVVGGAAGAVVGIERRDGTSAPRPNPAPAGLRAAAERERQLIADLDATTGGSATQRQVIVRARADHAAHLAAFEQLLAGFDPPAVTSTPGPGVSGSTAAVPSSAPSPSAPSPSAPSPSVPAGVPRTLAQLRRAEQLAGDASARAARGASGNLAALLASVAASEASHAAVLR